MTPLAWQITLILTALIMGSFAGMLAYRLPQIYLKQNTGLGLWFPRSHCPSCQEKLTIWQLLPLVSFIFLLGKCKKCRAPISWHYFILELVFLVVALAIFYYVPLMPAQMFVVTILVWWMLLLGYIDFKHGILPDELTLAGIWFGLIINTTAFGLIATANINLAIYGAAFGYAMPFVINWVFVKMRGYDGMGFGDFKMLAMVGAWLGIFDLLLVLMLASILGVLYIFGRYIIVRTSLHSPITFGAFIAITTIIITIANQLNINLYALLSL